MRSRERRSGASIEALEMIDHCLCSYIEVRMRGPEMALTTSKFRSVWTKLSLHCQEQATESEQLGMCARPTMSASGSGHSVCFELASSTGKSRSVKTIPLWIPESTELDVIGNPKAKVKGPVLV